MKDFSSGLLAGVDALGRRVPTDSLPSPRENRQVGIFYFLWSGEPGGYKPFNVSKIVEADPQAGYKPDSPVWGKIGQMHHWGEPFYGYYYSRDEWVVRKHMKLLMQADVDFLFFDTTNAVVYEDNAALVMRVLQEYHDEGLKIPKVMFYTNTRSGRTVQKIYDLLYAKKYCPDTWFYFEGKPVIIAVEEECSAECRAFFNIKKSQWPNEPDKLGGWPWMDFVRPQRVFKNMKGEDEVINVSVAQHPQIMFGDSVLYGETTNCGRAFHNGENDKAPDADCRGYNFAEQFDRAIETDPPVVLVTGWNEWIAGRWQGPPERPIRFVDCCNREYSRDIEMMRGGYFDNYFLQLVGYVRRYKGFTAPPVHEKGEITLYPATKDGTFRRDCDGYGERYVNISGRNAITGVSVCHDAEYVNFTLRSDKPLSGFGGGDFMTLFINGRFAVTPDGIFSLGEDFSRGRLCGIECNKSDNYIIYRVPLSLIGNSDGEFELTFKAADCSDPYSSVEDFYDKGDVLPLGRLEYLYKGK